MFLFNKLSKTYVKANIMNFSNRLKLLHNTQLVLLLGFFEMYNKPFMRKLKITQFINIFGRVLP